MSKAAGFLLILAGVGTAAYMVPSIDLRDRSGGGQVSDVVKTTVSPAAATSGPALVEGVIKAAPVSIRPASAPAVAPSSNGSAASVDPTFTGGVGKSGAGGSDVHRLTLTKEIQRELQRVGCYAGMIDGEWSTVTRQAMKSFIDRVNATLPIDAPDHILKTLVSGHPGDACSKACPVGQAMSNGRCLPSVIVAQAPRSKVVQAPQRVAAVDQKGTTPKAGRVPATEEAVVAPKIVAAPAPAVRPQAVTKEIVVSSWTSTVVPAPVASLPALPRETSPVVTAALPKLEPAATAAGTRPRVELPGKMAVGVGASVPETLLVQPKAVTADVSPSLDGSAAPAVKKVSRIVIKRAADGAKSAPAKPLASGWSTTVESAAAAKPVAKVESQERIAAVEPAGEKPQAAEPAGRDAVKRDAAPRPRAPDRSIAVYRAPMPPPRYVGVYNAPRPVYRERSTFGPGVFNRLIRDGR